MKKNKKKLPKSKLRVVVVTDVLYKWGGAEKHLKYILKTFPNSEIFTPYYDKEFTNKHFPDKKVHQSFLRFLPFKWKLRYFYLLLHPLAYKSFDFSDYDFPDFTWTEEEDKQPDPTDDSKELNTDDFDSFDNQCPKCGFEFNAKK